MSAALIALLIDVEADLLVLEKVVQRQVPNFQSATLAKVRAAIADLTGHDEAVAIRADLRINEMKSDGTLERMALERALAEQVKWGQT
jgi:hypothetical protein